MQNLIEMKKNDPLPLDVASQLCNSDILSRCTHFIAFAFHDSDVVYVFVLPFLVLSLCSVAYTDYILALRGSVLSFGFILQP